MTNSISVTPTSTSANGSSEVVGKMSVGINSFARPFTSDSVVKKMTEPKTGPNTVAAPPSKRMVQIQKVVVRLMESGCTDAPSDQMMPAKAPMTPPMTSACILYQYTLLPRARTASSSSRMPLRTRPHGDFDNRQNMSAKSATTIQPISMSHQLDDLVPWKVKNRIVTCLSGKGERFSKTNL